MTVDTVLLKTLYVLVFLEIHSRRILLRCLREVACRTKRPSRDPVRDDYCARISRSRWTFGNRATRPPTRPVDPVTTLTGAYPTSG